MVGRGRRLGRRRRRRLGHGDERRRVHAPHGEEPARPVAEAALTRRVPVLRGEFARGRGQRCDVGVVANSRGAPDGPVQRALAGVLLEGPPPRRRRRRRPALLRRRQDGARLRNDARLGRRRRGGALIHTRFTIFAMRCRASARRRSSSLTPGRGDDGRRGRPGTVGEAGTGAFKASGFRSHLRGRRLDRRGDRGPRRRLGSRAQRRRRAFQIKPRPRRGPRVQRGLEAVRVVALGQSVLRAEGWSAARSCASTWPDEGPPNKFGTRAGHAVSRRCSFLRGWLKVKMSWAWTLGPSRRRPPRSAAVHRRTRAPLSPACARGPRRRRRARGCSGSSSVRAAAAA